VRTAVFALAWACGLAVGAAGQTRPEVSVELAGDGTPVANVALHDLLADDRFVNAMESGFPLYVAYRVELKQPRSLWDRTVTAVEWEYVVLFDPVRERFNLEDAEGTEVLQDREALRLRLERVFVVELEPDAAGEFYYRASVDARTLSDEDVDEVFAWLKGENVDAARPQRPGFLTRAARRVLVQVAPLPRLQLEAQTPKFVHQR